MISLHEELIKILEEEKSLLSSLYEIVSAERDAIVSLNSDELERVLTKKQEVFTKLSLWENEREKLLNSQGMKGMNLRDLINRIEVENPGIDLSALKEIYIKMKSLLEAIAEIQKINEQLVDRSMIHIGTALKFLETFGIKAKQNLSREA